MKRSDSEEKNFRPQSPAEKIPEKKNNDFAEFSDLNLFPPLIDEKKEIVQKAATSPNERAENDPARDPLSEEDAPREMSREEELAAWERKLGEIANGEQQALLAMERMKETLWGLKHDENPVKKEIEKVNEMLKRCADILQTLKIQGVEIKEKIRYLKEG
jgi:hypothetical protein